MIRIIDFLLTILKPFIILIGKMHWPFTHKKVTGQHYYKLRDQINIGTVFLTRTHGEISNFFNPSKFKHAAIYVGTIKNDEICYVLEATYSGVKLTDLVSFLTSKDLVYILEPTFKKAYPGDFSKEIQAIALSYVGIPYDFSFSMSGKSFYCFELVANIFKRMIPYIGIPYRTFLGSKKIYDGNSFLNANQFKLISILGKDKA